MPMFDTLQALYARVHDCLTLKEGRGKLIASGVPSNW